ncbi:MAG: histidine kinase [Bacillota bacterium]
MVQDNLDSIVSRTLQAIEDSKKEIFAIVARAQAETQELKAKLNAIAEEKAALRHKIDELAEKDYEARLMLMEVSKDFRHYSEEDIRRAYEQAQKLQIELIELRANYQVTSYRYEELLKGIERVKESQEKAERLMSQVGVVLNYMNNEFQDLSDRLDEVNQFQKLRLKVIEAQEEERKRVAREIHDGPAQSMANIVMRADYCARLIDKDPSQLRSELKGLQDLVRASLDDVRKIIFDLRPMVLDDLGLAPALKRFIEQYSKQYDIKTDLAFHGKNERLGQIVEVALFRIIQEALNNVAKHARATHVLVKVEVSPEKISVMVKDDGKGFDVDKIRPGDKGGYGLVGIRERVQILQGHLSVISKPGHGTTIKVVVPVQNR